MICAHDLCLNGVYIFIEPSRALHYRLAYCNPPNSKYIVIADPPVVGAVAEEAAATTTDMDRQVRRGVLDGLLEPALGRMRTFDH